MERNKDRFNGHTKLTFPRMEFFNTEYSHTIFSRKYTCSKGWVGTLWRAFEEQSLPLQNHYLIDTWTLTLSPSPTQRLIFPHPPKIFSFILTWVPNLVLSCLVLSWGARLPGNTARLAVRCRSLTARGTSNLPTQAPKGRGREEAKSDPREGLQTNGGGILWHQPRPLLLGAGSEASSPHGRNLSGDLTQKVRTREVLCLSESLSFYTKYLVRGRFLFLIPPPSCLDYRGHHLPPEESTTFAAD